MALYSVWFLGADDIALSEGSLDGQTQGDASHLLNVTLTFQTNAWQESQIEDDDAFFDDNDGSGQRLAQPLTLGSVTYPENTRIEAEYTIQFEDPDGNVYTAYGFNVNNSNPAYATIEGLAFLGDDGDWPPVGVPLTIISVDEGPGDFGNSGVLYDDLVAPICFAAGTRLATPDGPVAVERLAVGDLVLTRDHGAQAVRWIGCRRIGPAAFAAARGEAPARFAPVRIEADAFGPGRPARPLRVSPQHRLAFGGWEAELHFGAAEVLVAARHLVGRPGVSQEAGDAPVTYWHVMFDRHEIVSAEGMPAESFRAGPEALRAVSAAARAELYALFPALRGPAAGLRAARPVISAAEAAVLRT